MFGYTLVKKQELKELVKTVEDLVDLVYEKGGFVNEKNNFESNGNNEVIKNHWSKVHKLSGSFYNLKRKLKITLY